MASKVNRLTYEKMVQEDIEWLDKQPKTLERDHIRLILQHSVDHEYPPKIIANIEYWDSDWIEVNWVWEGKGFGQINIHKTAAGVITDTEYMSRESVRQIMAAVVDSLRFKDEEEDTSEQP